ncbi:MAG: class I SAM-dependent methyltransferase [Nitrososphaerota archaeon]
MELGRYSIKIAKKECETIALDISLEMLKRIKEKIKRDKIINRINLILAEAENLPFKDKIFNSLICTLTINHFNNLEKIAKEFSRILKKDSICIISTFNSYALKIFQRKCNIPNDMIPFKTEDVPPILVYEVGYSAKDVEKIFLRHEFKIKDVKGCCYWHFFPSILIEFYPTFLDKLFNLFKVLLKYAEINIILMKKNQQHN